MEHNSNRLEKAKKLGDSKHFGLNGEHICLWPINWQQTSVSKYNIVQYVQVIVNLE